MEAISHVPQCGILSISETYLSHIIFWIYISSCKSEFRAAFTQLPRMSERDGYGGVGASLEWRHAGGGRGSPPPHYLPPAASDYRRPHDAAATWRASADDGSQVGMGASCQILAAGIAQEVVAAFFTRLYWSRSFL